MPTEDKVTRKLRAILSADVKGYSLLMSDDEAFTIKTLKEYRGIMSTQIQEHHGRVVDAPGDNLLAEFSSAVDAVTCAVEIQKILKSKNDQLEDDKKLQYRIGVNIGDIVQDGDRIYGSGVNVAARIEGLAEPGGICISRNAYDHIKDKLNFGFRYLGDHDVKNIKDPVRVYKVLTDPEDAGILIEERSHKQQKKWPALAIATVAILIGIIVWQFYYEKSPPIEAALVENMAFPLPDKPSIAVLPFKNLNDDPAQDYIGDGITENIVSALSKISEMFVISRDSTSTYKGKPVKIKQVSEELGVQYVLEGSTQKSGNRVRVTAQLIDATTGHYLWSEKYDRELHDIFALQDEITHKIIVELQVKLTEGEQARLSQKSTTNLEAWNYANRGLALWMRPSPENNAKAMALFEKAVELDPNYVWAWVKLAWTHSVARKPGFSQQSPAEHLKMLFDISEKVLTMDESDSDVQALSGLAHLYRDEPEKAIAAGEKSIVLSPTNAQSHALLAVSMNTVGRFEDVIRLVQKAMRLHPYYPAYYLTWLGGGYRMTGRYEEALSVYKQFLDRSLKGEYPVIAAHLYLAELYAEIGKVEEARVHAAEIFKIEPGFSLENIDKINTYHYSDPTLLEPRLKALRKAGIPNNPPLPLPDKPSIAVLAFDNLSDDPKQEYFSDGIAENIINALSKVGEIFVIARNSSFTYKGTHVKIQQIGRELGVKYVLEGSVQKRDNRIRITVQLIDAITGRHLWSERYDRKLEDLFALQDEITLKTVTSLRVKLTKGEMERVAGTDNLNAYLKHIQAVEFMNRWNIEGNALSRKFAEEAINLDPEYADAYLTLGKTHLLDLMYGTTESKERSLKIAEELVEKALSLDPESGKAYGNLGRIYLTKRQYDEAIAVGERSIKLEPNSAFAHYAFAYTLHNAGKPEEAIGQLKIAIRLSPIAEPWYHGSLGVCYRMVGRSEEAVPLLKKVIQHNQNDVFAHLELAATYIELGREEDAKSEAAEVLRINPDFSLESYRKGRLYKNPEDLDRVINALKRAGLS